MKRLIGAVILVVLLAGSWLFWSVPTTSPAGDSFTVTLSVNAAALIDNIHLLDREKHELLPSDGIIFEAAIVEASKGESAFDVLQREMRNAGIHMAFRNTPAYNSTYITAIGNIYEFDAGPLSGWMYKVNDDFPSFGSSRYLLKPGDVIEIMYTLDLGRDANGFVEGE